MSDGKNIPVIAGSFENDAIVAESKPVHARQVAVQWLDIPVGVCARAMDARQYSERCSRSIARIWAFAVAVKLNFNGMARRGVSLPFPQPKSTKSFLL